MPRGVRMPRGVAARRRRSLERLPRHRQRTRLVLPGVRRARVGRVAVARMSGSDPRKIRATLEAAEGYAVFDSEGKRLGAFVELAADDRIAIRHDGVFVWHRRLLPITDVVNVIPDQRAVVLKVSKRTLADTKAPASQAPA